MVEHREDKLHQFIWRALNMLLPDDCVAWSNENRRNGIREGARRKARGCIAGVPDMEFHYRGRALCVELKAERGRLSPEQRVLHARLKAAGTPVAVCRSLDDVIDFLRAQGVPVKGAVMA